MKFVTRILCIPSQTTTHNKETSSHIQHSKALHHSGRPHTRMRTATTPPLIIVDREEKWEVEEILDSHWHRRRFQFLVKWKGYGREHNSWEAVSNVSAPNLIVEYYHKYPAAPRYIH